LEETTQRISDDMQKHCGSFFKTQTPTLDVIKKKKYEMRRE
jgi:hypothetical protein